MVSHINTNRRRYALVCLKLCAFQPSPLDPPPTNPSHMPKTVTKLYCNCDTWCNLQLIQPSAVSMPGRLAGRLITGFAPAYWVVPSRCYLHQIGTIATPIRQTSQVFMRFKVGETQLAYILALGMHAVLVKRKLLAFDAVVPIPLSPEKTKEVHRSNLLSKEVARLLRTRVAPLLSLNREISKHRLRTTLGLSAVQFEALYSSALVIDHRVKRFNQILLVDDVCTEGSTLSCAIKGLRRVNPKLEITVATAGQMIVKAAVRNQAALLTPTLAVG